MNLNKGLLLEKETLVALLLLIAVVGLIVPYGFPLFTIIVFIYFIVYFFTKNLKLYKNPYLIFMYLSALLYFWGMALNGGIIFNNNIMDIQEIILIFMLTLMVGNINKDSFKKTIRRAYVIISIVLPAISIFSLYKFILLLKGIQLDFIKFEGRPYPWGTTLMPDYNMFSLGMSISLCIIISLYRKTSSFFIQNYYLFSILIIIISIIFSGSRRGWIVIGLIIVYFLITFAYKIFKSKDIVQIGKITVALLFLFSIIFIIKDLIPTSEFNVVEFEKLKYRFATLNNLEESYSERTLRWEYATTMIEEYNIFQLFFGSGFEYLTDYANKFVSFGTEDYPHNPFISTFHYSGLLGLIVFITILFVTLVKLILNKRTFGNEFILIFILQLLFLVSSLNTIYSIKIFWLFIFLVLAYKQPTTLPGECSKGQQRSYFLLRKGISDENYRLYSIK